MHLSGDVEMDALVRHLAEVEMELATYAAAYGLTDNARRLLATSPLSKSVKLGRVPAHRK